MGNTVRRPIAQSPLLRFEAQGPRHGAGGCHTPSVPRARDEGNQVSTSLLAGARMVLARWDTRHRHSVLSRAPAIDEDREALHAGSGGRQPKLADANTAPRGGARHRFGLSTEAPESLAGRIRTGLAAVSGHLPPAAGQPPLRAAPGPAGPPSPSHPRLPPDVCGPAQTPFRLAPRISWLAGHF